ncbi:MAG: ankyrin repeat domain-containing protein [Nitrospinae bacterium]|nr:ankyrin repeat domain-containing protein [Nitrospinota bacterium]
MRRLLIPPYTRNHHNSILLEHGANPNISANDGFTPLMGAILNDNIEIAKELLRRGALLNQHDKNGETPYSIARDSGNKVMLSMLTEYE